MKLTSDVQARLSGRVNPEPRPEPKSMLAHALALAEQGWNVFPLRPGSKVPLLPRAHDKGVKCNGECGRDGHGAHDGTTDPDQIRRWWSKHPTAGIGANLGEDRIAIDIDVQHGGVLQDGVFPPTRVHHSGRGNGNQHLIYRYEPGSAADGVKSGTNVLGDGIDIRTGRGSYIVMPPTAHEETGRAYTVGGENSGIETLLEDEDVQAIWDAYGQKLSARSRAASKGLSALTGGKAAPKSTESKRSTSSGGVRLLSDLLDNPPTRGKGQTNDWLARVAGHYAKQYADKRDLYESHVRAAAKMVKGEPYPMQEVEKTLESIWSTEEANHTGRGASINNGFLTGNGRALFCQVSHREGEEMVYDQAPYADFDLTAQGVAVDDTGRRIFWVRLHWHGTQIDTTIDARTLADSKSLSIWLAQYGASLDQPFNAFPKMPATVRLLRYLNAQEPPTVEVADTLGYHEKAGGFVTHDGVITADGPVAKEQAGVVADLALLERRIAPFEYGFEGDWENAQAVLAEVLTYQEQQTASVFGAWWAACLLKPQITARTSLFPFFGVEATSESGKTNGIFDMLVQLNGNTKGQVVPTRPVMRDYSSANQSGIVWADDLDDLAPYGELLRASTSNGVAAKMDADRIGVKDTRIVAPLFISGEALAMDSQKALIDRAVIIGASSPKNRRSTKGDYPQWDDVVAMRERYPESEGGLAVLAGWFVQHALTVADQVMEVLKAQKRQHSGRAADKNAVLLAGAALLDSMCGEPDPWNGQGLHSRTVRDWIEGSPSTTMDQDNALTLKVIPWALRAWDFPTEPVPTAEAGRYAGIQGPVWVYEVPGDPSAGHDGYKQVWVQVAALADAWERHKNGRVDARLETLGALRAQMDAIGAKSKVKKVAGRAVRFRVLPAVYAKAVLDRAQ